jgi:hypothetical protein
LRGFCCFWGRRSHRGRWARGLSTPRDVTTAGSHVAPAGIPRVRGGAVVASEMSSSGDLTRSRADGVASCIGVLH